MTPTPESVLQARTKERLIGAGWFVAKLSLTFPTGLPDLMCIKDGRTVFVEMKREGEQPRALQCVRHRQMRKAGAIVIVNDGTEDVLTQIENELQQHKDTTETESKA